MQKGDSHDSSEIRFRPILELFHFAFHEKSTLLTLDTKYSPVDQNQINSVHNMVIGPEISPKIYIRFHADGSEKHSVHNDAYKMQTLFRDYF